MDIQLEDIIKLLAALVVGGLIGAERELRHKVAGFRTLIFICLGATLFTLLSLKLCGGSGDRSRIAANIVSGVGFLGAGAIWRDGGRISGLTTASAIWVAAALGMGIGAGEFALIALATGLLLVVLAVFPNLEYWLEGARYKRLYELAIPARVEKLRELEARVHECGLQIRTRRQQKEEDRLICHWILFGPPANHQRLLDLLVSDPDVHQAKS